ncbi:MAG: hypothetical protein HY823_10485 [Acidobacteria bacterium]|nr:hypothetical protein [Acidobacteriota bacterium]
MTLWKLFSLLHLLGLGLAVGAAATKVSLLLAARSDRSLVSFYLQVAGRITPFIVGGLMLLSLSGIGWMLLGRPFTLLLIAKLSAAALLWMVGPLIDKVVEPRFRSAFSMAGAAPSNHFLRAERSYIHMEVAATALMFAATVMGALL